MVTKMPTIFTLIEKKGWKIDSTILNGMQTLCENFKFITILGSEIYIVRERYGRAGTDRVGQAHFENRI